MTTATDPGVDFWLDYVTAEGGLHERVGAASLVVLPEDLQERHRQDAEMTVTADPDVAREDRAMLMTVGHPLLTAAAESVLAQGDVGVVRLERPTSRTPDLAQLQNWARDRFPVDHGRVDLTGGPRPSVRCLLRVSSLATFTMSSDDRFQEQIECWVDVPSGRPLVDGNDRRLADLVAVEHAEREQLDPDTPGLANALAAVDAEIGRRAEARRVALGDSVLPSLRAERDRARDYYQQMADSLRKRMATAATDKVAGYQARLDHTQAERDRRLAEIEEKYRSSVQCLPFRLHLVGVPSLQVEAGIRRGSRWYPVDLEWLSPVRRFAPVACPGCGSDEILVAGKDGLGCRSCRPPRPLTSVPEPGSAGRPDGLAGEPMAKQPTRASAASSERARTPVAESERRDPGRRPGPGGRSDPAVPKPDARQASGNSHDRPGASGTSTSTRTGPSARTVTRPGASGTAARPATRGRSRVGPSPAAMTRAGSKMIMRLWERVEGGDRAIAGMCAPDGPAAASVRVFGSDGPRIAVGLPNELRLRSVASSTSEHVPGTDFWLTIGRLGASDHVDHPFQVLWHMINGRPLIDEVVGMATGVWPWLPTSVSMSASRAGRWDLELTPRQVAATADDPVARLVLDRTAPIRGIAIAARCLAAWWRLDPSVTAELVETAGSRVVTAALDKQVSMRASTARRADAHVAADYGVYPAAVKSMGPRLQRRLALGPLKPW
ncbi:MAG TPA: hypothetical protein VIU11_15150 [Nakamurella sp.]